MNTSIIIPTYNNYKILKSCIDSLLINTDFSDKEIIVSANGCVDGTKEYLKTLPNFVKVIWEDNAIGFVRAVNNGFHQASGEYIVLFNDDITILNNYWFTALTLPFQYINNCGITGAAKWFYNINGKSFPQIAFWCACFKKPILNKVGYLDDIFNPGNGEDIDFCIKMHLAGLEIVGVPDNYTDESQIKDTTFTMFPINHLDGTTFSREHEKSMQLRLKNAKILEERYG